MFTLRTYESGSGYSIYYKNSIYDTEYMAERVCMFQDDFEEIMFKQYSAKLQTIRWVSGNFLFFKNKKKAEEAIDWLNSIIIAKKLTL